MTPTASPFRSHDGAGAGKHVVSQSFWEPVAAGELPWTAACTPVRTESRENGDTTAPWMRPKSIPAWRVLRRNGCIRNMDLRNRTGADYTAPQASPKGPEIIAAASCGAASTRCLIGSKTALRRGLAQIINLLDPE